MVEFDAERLCVDEAGVCKFGVDEVDVGKPRIEAFACGAVLCVPGNAGFVPGAPPFSDWPVEVEAVSTPSPSDASGVCVGIGGSVRGSMRTRATSSGAG